MLSGKGNLIDLSEVMIFGGQPEDGNVRDTGRALCISRAGDGGSGLQKGQERTTE